MLLLFCSCRCCEPVADLITEVTAHDAAPAPFAPVAPDDDYWLFDPYRKWLLFSFHVVPFGFFFAASSFPASSALQLSPPPLSLLLWRQMFALGKIFLLHHYGNVIANCLTCDVGHGGGGGGERSSNFTTFRTFR